MRLLRRLGYWLRFGARQSDLQEELSHHRALVAADFERRGLSPNESRDAARRAMGNETAMREQARAVWLAPLLDALLQDWRYAWRGLRRAPSFTTIAVASLALGIGANTAIFGLIHGLLLARLPVPAAGQLVRLQRDLGVRGEDDRFSHAEFVAMSSTPVPLAAFGSSFATIDIDGVQSSVGVEVVDRRYFEMLGLSAQRGRLIGARDDADPVIVVTDSFWRGRMNGDASAIGRTIKIAGQPYSVIGVTPPGFAGLRFPAIADVFLPYRTAVTRGVLRGVDDRRQSLTIVGRRGVSQRIQSVQRTLEPLWERCCATGLLATSSKGQVNPAARLAVDDVSRGVPIAKMDLRRQFARVLFALMAGVGVLLLAACANVANLLLARGSARAGELAMRLALGASRSRLVVQLVIESLQLSLLGAGAGLLLAWWASTLLSAERIGDLARVVHSNIGSTLLVFATAVSIGSSVVFAVVPAVRTMRVDLVTPLSQAGRRAAVGGRGLFDRGLVSLQVALAVLLVSGATLLVQTLRNLQDTNLGFDPTRRLAEAVETRGTSYERHRMTSQLAGEILRRVRAIPGVRSAGLGSLTPVAGGRTMFDNVTVPGAPPPADGDPQTVFVGVTPEYFATLRIPLLAGHDIGPPVAQFPAGTVRYVVINDLFAKKFFGGRNPIGQVFRDADDGDTTFTEDRVAGIVGSVRYADPRSPATPMYFVPIADGDWPFLTLVIDASGDLAPITAAASRAISSAAPGIGRGDPTLLSTEVDRALIRERIAATLAALFGAIALSLVAVGLYGVMLYQVTERTTEIGIRMALGARPGAVIGLVVRQSLAIVAVGLAAGVPLALLAGRAVSAQLYGVAPYSAWALVVATAGLLVVAGAACLVPVQRAVGVDPLTALRST